VAHTRDIAEVRITSNLNEAADNESWGIRDFFLFTAGCSATNCTTCTGPGDNDCTKCAENYALSNGKCNLLANFILLNKAFEAKTFTGIDGWTITGS